MGQAETALRVRADVEPGPHFVGQGFELVVIVAASDQRPKLDLPRVSGARIWTIGTEFKPISVSGIGAMVAQEILFVTRLRVVSSRSGALEIPPIHAQLGNRSGRTRTIHLKIQPVPPEGRPAEFLGGVGRFSLEAQASPNTVRVGQELELRIKVSGPAAWGMTGRPEFRRFHGLGVDPTIDPLPDEAIDEPPSRTFVYRLRPMRPGESNLPPVAIAAFDPVLGRYLTRVTSGVPIRAVSVPAFDPRVLESATSLRDAHQPEWVVLAVWGFGAAALLAAFAALARLRRRLPGLRPHGPAAARRYAARLARILDRSRARLSPAGTRVGTRMPGAGEPSESGARSAGRVTDGLTRYLEIGAGRPRGALTPDEARDNVARLTGREDLGEYASQLAALCDAALYGNVSAAPKSSEVLETAWRLFEALGRVKTAGPSADEEASHQ
jgi:hypothetical protein